MSLLRMTGVVSRPYMPSLLQNGAHFSPLISKLVSIRLSRPRRIQAGCSIVRAAMSSMDSNTDLVTKTEAQPEQEKVELACPVCYSPLTYSGFQSPNLLAAKVLGGSLSCKSCRKSYKNDKGIIDLTIQSNGAVALGASFFANPLVAFVYERGYRSFFALGNFPGFDDEAQMAQRLLESARGEVIMDLSCGPGGFARRFLASGEYEMVIASDFSQAMLEECRGFLEGDSSADLSKVVVLRADAARLPFATGSVAGIHAAAAIHAWPNVLSSVAEISRVLRPGGKFVASTFILPTPAILADGSLKSVRQWIDALQLPFNWFTEEDLKEVTEGCGLVDWYSYRKGAYILFSASKPT